MSTPWEAWQLGLQLIQAAYLGNNAQVTALLDAGVSVNFRNGSQWTALLAAAAWKQVETVALLLERNAEVDAQNEWGATALVFACDTCCLEVVALLIDAGANVNIRASYFQFSPLIQAAWQDRFPICELLLSKGADLLAADIHGWTAMSHYGYRCPIALPPEILTLRRTALEAVWRRGPHPSQVQRRRDEAWDRRKVFLTLLAEFGYRPLANRALVIYQAAEAAQTADPTQRIFASSVPKEVTFRDEGLVRYITAFL